MDHTGETVPGRGGTSRGRKRFSIAKGVLYSVLAVAFGLAVRAAVRAFRSRRSA